METKYTDQQLEEFLTESNAIEGVYSARAFNDAKRAWEYLMTQEVLTLDVIKHTHFILMGTQDAWEPSIVSHAQKYRGEFRDCDVYVGRQKCLDPHLVESHLLMQFCFETMRVNPKPEWKELHVLYEKIHPFVDGNGRTGRMFMNWTRFKRCGLGLKTIYKKDVSDYYSWFK